MDRQLRIKQALEKESSSKHHKIKFIEERTLRILYTSFNVLGQGLSIVGKGIEKIFDHTEKPIAWTLGILFYAYLHLLTFVILPSVLDDHGGFDQCFSFWSRVGLASADILLILGRERLTAMAEKIHENLNRRRD